MSLHLKPTMSKSRRVSSPGIFSFRASAVPTKKRRETNAQPDGGRRPLAGGPYMGGFQRRQPAFLRYRRNWPVGGLGLPSPVPRASLQDRVGKRRIKTLKSLKIRNKFARLS